jgi:ADP-heptose:LPS heptosyltransferase
MPVLIPGKWIEVQSILILHQGALGDFILALPTLANLRKALPQARCVIMGYPRILELVDKRYYAEEVLSIDQKGMASFFVQGGPLDRSLSQFFSQFDLTVVFGKGGGVTIAENLKRVCRGGILQINSFPPWDEKIHVTDHLLSELSRHGFPMDEKKPRLYLNGSDREWGKEFWSANAVKPEERREMIVIHPGSGSKKKVWPVGRFLELSHHLQERLHSKLLVVIGPAEGGETQRLFEGMKLHPPIFARGLSLLQLASIMEDCRLFIGNDSGVSHLAAALGIPVLAVFGPTDPEVWSPRGQKVVVVRREIPCSPCPQERFFQCGHSDCLKEVSVGDVLRGVGQLEITS